MYETYIKIVKSIKIIKWEIIATYKRRMAARNKGFQCDFCDQFFTDFQYVMHFKLDQPLIAGFFDPYHAHISLKSMLTHMNPLRAGNTLNMNLYIEGFAEAGIGAKHFHVSSQDQY